MKSSPRKLGWYKRSPAKFIAGTVGLRWEIKTCYSVVLDLIYDGGGKCPDDPQWVANMLGVGMTVRHWNIIRDELVRIGKLTPIDGFLTNKAASRILARDEPATASPSPEEPLKNQILAGEKIAQNRSGLFADKDLAQNTPPKVSPVPARARENQNQSQSQIEPDLSIVIVEVEEIAKALNQQRGRYWESDYRRLIGEGLSHLAILEAARAHKGDPIRGLAQLRGLAKRKQEDLEWQGKASAPGGVVGATVTAATHTEAQWEEHLGMLLTIGNWVASEYGPCPTRPGHVVPLKPYARWHALWVKQGSHPKFEYDRQANRVPYPAAEPSATFRATWQPQP